MPTETSLRAHLTLSATARLMRADALLRRLGACPEVARAYAGAYKAATMAGMTEQANVAAARAHAVREML